MKELYENLDPKIKERLSKCKLLILDFDGVLTDNKVIVNQEGIEAVKCDRGDGFGLELLRKYTRIKVLILSKEINSVTKKRADKLQIYCISGVQDKIFNFHTELENYKVTSEEVCFIGNDFNDIECMKESGIGVAVKDAHPQVLKISDYITTKKGGDGAVREICELIMYSKDVHPYL